MCTETDHLQTYVRELEIDLLSDSLKLHQKFEGDVSCVVWDASIVLAKYLEEKCKRNKEYLKGLNVLELGAGVGCVGLTAACLGANVSLTDLPEVLPLLNKNIGENRKLFKKFNGTVRLFELKWGETPTTNVKFHKIFLADCVYYEKSINNLLYTLTKLCDTNTEILIAQELRDSKIQMRNWESFLLGLKQQFKTYEIPLSEQCQDYSSKDIALLSAFKISS